MKVLRAALIGFGMMGKNHARIMNDLEQVELVGVFDPEFNLANSNSNINFMNNINEILELNLDYCMVAVPTELHEHVSLFLADNHIAALIEKPLAHNLKVAERISKAFKDNNVKAAVGHIERFNPALLEAKAMIQRGELGEIYQIETRRINGFPSRIKDVGVTFDLASHDIDLTMWLSGQPYISVKAQSLIRKDRLNEDVLTVSGKLQTGIIVNHLVNWITPIKERKISILGEKGMLICDTLNVDLYFHSNKAISTDWENLRNFRGISEGDMTKFAIQKKEPLLIEHENFRDYLLGIDAKPVTLEEACEVVKVAEWILKDSGQMVNQ